MFGNWCVCYLKIVKNLKMKQPPQDDENEIWLEEIKEEGLENIAIMMEREGIVMEIVGEDR